MSDPKPSRVITIGPATALWADLFSPKARPSAPGSQPNTPKYELTLGFKASALTDEQRAIINDVNSAIDEVAKATFPTIDPQYLKLKKFFDGTEQNKRNIAAGNKAAKSNEGFIVLKTNTSLDSPPQLARREADGSFSKHPVPQDFYSGCEVIATVCFKAYDNSGNRGVANYLQVAIKWADGERLGGGSSISVDDVIASLSATKVPSSSAW